jgi:hypothetical protein
MMAPSGRTYGLPVHKPEILLLYLPSFKQFREVLVGSFVFGENDHTTGIPIQPVHGEYFTIGLFQHELQGRLFVFPVGNAEHSGGLAEGYKMVSVYQYINRRVTHYFWTLDSLMGWFLAA